mgnify:CR=1 FL=1|tara:strand:+ start:407 stop:598 length:192 start_codon:yes stop_codon:yes gene_type:complete
MGINHTDYPRQLKKLPMDALQHIINDCRRAIEAMPENPKCSQYADEIAYCSMEKTRRFKNAGY